MTNKEIEEIRLNRQIALRIKALRIKHEPIQAKFAKENLIDRQVLNRWENSIGKRGMSLHSLNKFCKMVGITLSEFFDDDLFRIL